MRYKSVLFSLFLVTSLPNLCSAMMAGDSGVTYKDIESAMKHVVLDDQCHVNILRLAVFLKSSLNEEEFAKISVLILRPEGLDYEATYLPNSVWLHHVALIFDGHVFDFFNNNLEKITSGQKFSNYINENFFDFRKKYKAQVFSIGDPNLYRGFSSLGLIEKYRRVTIECIKVSARHYLGCVGDGIINFAELEKDPSISRNILSYDKSEFILWYKEQFNGIIHDVDALLLWSDLCDLHWEAIAMQNWDFSMAEGVTESFNWPELKDMEGKWQRSELTWFKYYDLVRNCQNINN